MDPSVGTPAFLALLGVHVLAGLFALGAGFGAIVTTKGGRRHNAAGRLYVLSMAVVVTTAVPLAVWVENWFLLAIAAFSGYLVFGGYRVIRQLRRPPAERPPWIGTHIAFMGGGYIATVTATVTVNLTMLPPLVRWLGPTAVGVPLIVYATRSYVPRFSRPERPAE
ncbi:hypothetical protein BRC69_03275 [Halobacteriales archaeon QH_6_66_25]|nr:MAG: hypothetical protein BRC69_03275 [Halobacteriales archaeon QH_6_66_25]